MCEEEKTTYKEDSGIKLPLWSVGIFSGLLISFSAWAGSTILEVRDRTAVLNEKVRRIEEGDADRRRMPVDIAEIKTELSSLRSELSALRHDIRNKGDK
jgi:hypothetical protein